MARPAERMDPETTVGPGVVQAMRGGVGDLIGAMETWGIWGTLLIGPILARAHRGIGKWGLASHFSSINFHVSFHRKSGQIHQFSRLMAVNANDLRKGTAITYNNDVCVVLEVTHRTPGNLRAFVQAILRSIRTGKSMDVRFSSTEKVETVPLMTYKMEFSYKSGEDYVFVNPESFEEVTVTPELVGDAKNYLIENAMVTMTFVEEKAVQVEIPPSVILTIKDAPEGIRGDSANNVQKTATLETGVPVLVPLFIKTGERIKVDTRTGKYMERA